MDKIQHHTREIAEHQRPSPSSRRLSAEFQGHTKKSYLATPAAERVEVSLRRWRVGLTFRCATGSVSLAGTVCQSQSLLVAKVKRGPPRYAETVL